MHDNKLSWEERALLRIEKAVLVLDELEKWMAGHATSVRATMNCTRNNIVTIFKFQFQCGAIEV